MGGGPCGEGGGWGDTVGTEAAGAGILLGLVLWGPPGVPFRVEGLRLHRCDSEIQEQLC